MIRSTRLAAAILALALGTISASAHAGIVSSQVYKPTTIADTQVEFRGEPPQAASVTTDDGLTLEGAYWPPDNGVDQVVVVFHGNSYNHLISAYRAEPLRVGGRGVLVASYRGYGDNPGRPSEQGLYTDAQAWIAHARSLHPEARIYVFGFSLGGAVAMEMATRHDFAGVATLGAFTRLRDQVPRVARALVTERYDNLAAIGRIEEPVLLLHGTEDDVVDPEAVARLEKAGGSNVTRINLNGAGHGVELDTIASPLWDQWERLEAGRSGSAER